MSHIRVERPHIGVDTHIVVIENYKQIIGRVGGVVYTLEGKASADACIAYYSHHVAARAVFLQLTGHSHAQSRGYRV